SIRPIALDTNRNAITRGSSSRIGHPRGGQGERGVHLRLSGQCCTNDRVAAVAVGEVVGAGGELLGLAGVLGAGSHHSSPVTSVVGQRSQVRKPTRHSLAATRWRQVATT